MQKNRTKQQTVETKCLWSQLIINNFVMVKKNKIEPLLVRNQRASGILNEEKSLYLFGSLAGIYCNAFM